MCRIPRPTRRHSVEQAAQATETEALREALQRREREYQDRHLSRTLSKPFANFGRRISGASQEAAL